MTNLARSIDFLFYPRVFELLVWDKLKGTTYVLPCLSNMPLSILAKPNFSYVICRWSFSCYPIFILWTDWLNPLGAMAFLVNYLAFLFVCGLKVHWANSSYSFLFSVVRAYPLDDDYRRLLKDFLFARSWGYFCGVSFMSIILFECNFPVLLT